MMDDITTLEYPRVASSVKRKSSVEDERSTINAGDEVEKDKKVFCTSFDSRIGRIYVASTENGVCKISVPRESRKDFFVWLKQHFEMDAINDNRSRNKDIIDQLTRYFNGRLAKFTCPLDLHGTPFQIRVWKELAKIQYGSTITYKHLAKRVHAPKAFQAVGRANGANPLPIVVPCHRVIGSDGSLVGYAYGIKTKEFLLRLEGAIIL
jgi:methylated-DNA-[protein]-cysteine S-methyltransferase